MYRCFFFTELPLTLRSYIDAPSVQTKKTSVVYCPIKQVSLSMNVLLSIPAPRPESHTSFHHHGLPFHDSNCFWLVLAVALAVIKRTGGTLENCPIAYVSVTFPWIHWASRLVKCPQYLGSECMRTGDFPVDDNLGHLLAMAPSGFLLWRWGFLFLPQLVMCVHRVHLMLKGGESDINPLEGDQSLSRLVWSYTVSNKYLGLGTLRLCQYPVSQRPVPRCGIPASPLQLLPPGSSLFCVYYLEF